MMSKKPCPNCPEQKSQQLTRTQADLFQDRIIQQVTQTAHLIREGKLDSVITILTFRRDLAVLAQELEPCTVCRPDIQMSAEFDQLMIDAKMARLEYATGRWKAFKMFLRFQWNVFGAVRRWVIRL